MSDMVKAPRTLFEEIISKSPFERSIERFPDDQELQAWPGNYKDINVQLAWNMWEEAWKHASGNGDMLCDPGYQRFLEEIAEDCKCCPECHECPCGSCQAGAPCDAYECECNGDYDDLETGEFYEYGDDPL
jgi:hypothetical protein